MALMRLMALPSPLRRCDLPPRRPIFRSAGPTRHFDRRCPGCCLIRF